MQSFEITRKAVLHTARETTPDNAINTIYYRDLDITHINSWRIISKKKDRHDNVPLQQKQYFTHYVPMIMKRPPIFKKAGFAFLKTTFQYLGQPLSVHAVRFANLNLKKNEPPFKSMSETSAIEPITLSAIASRKLAAVQKERERELTKMITESAQLVLT